MDNHVIASLAAGQLGCSQSDFVVVEWSDDGDGVHEWIASLHVHHEDDEAWYVLEGMLRFRLNDEVFDVGAGGAVLAPKGYAHAYGNASPGQSARYLLIMTPRIAELVRALHQPDAGDAADIFRAHASELCT